MGVNDDKVGSGRVGGSTKKGTWDKLLLMAWQQVKVKKAHVNVSGPRDVPQCSTYGVSRQLESFRMNSILCLSYYAMKSILLNAIV